MKETIGSALQAHYIAMLPSSKFSDLSYLYMNFVNDRRETQSFS